MKAVITTIQAPTEAIKVLSKKMPLIVIGDKKTPLDWSYPGVEYRLDAGYEVGGYLPDNHYSRKNLGYLLAMESDPEVIYDTDDDNVPNDNWKVRTEYCSVRSVNGSGWYNVYRRFLLKNIWPRGFSLKSLEADRAIIRDYEMVPCPIQQGMADREPDVDALWRITSMKDVFFSGTESLVVRMWCPFNSQSTWWFPKAYPLMYLPVHAPFRMTDIWRSFVAQRCLWQMGYGVAFHSPAEVIQDRNNHDLIEDFRDEIPGYLNNHIIAERFDKLVLGTDVYANMVTCYKELIKIGVLPEDEIYSLLAWIHDTKRILKPNLSSSQGK